MANDIDTITPLDLTKIHVHPQDRKAFAEDALRQLAASIDEAGPVEDGLPTGLAQPITLRPCLDSACPNHGEPVLVAGERRFRSHSFIKGATKIKAIIRQMSDEEASLVQLVENEQRADLDPMEQANAYQTRLDTYGGSIEALAKKVGKPAAYIRNRLELLKLDEQWAALVQSGDLPVAHAQTMGRLDNNRQRLAIAALRKGDRSTGRTSGDAMTFWQFEQICNKLYADQQQDSMFDASMFEDEAVLESLVEHGRMNAPLAGRDLFDLIDDLGKVIEAIGVAKVVELGIDEGRLDVLMHKVGLARNNVRKSRRDKKAAQADKPKRRRSTSRRAE